MELAPHRLTVLFDTPKAFPVAFVPPKWAKTSDFFMLISSLLLSLTIKTQQGQASKPYVFKNTNMKIQDMTMSERIKMQMQKLNLKSKDLIEATKASKGTVSQWVNGGNEPSAQYIAPLAKVLRVSEQWLLLGGAQRQKSPVANTRELQKFLYYHYSRRGMERSNESGFNSLPKLDNSLG